MKKQAIATLVLLASTLCPLALATPNDGIGEQKPNQLVLRGGLAVPQDLDIELSGGSGSSVSFENGYSASIAYGRRLVPWLRGEIEVGWIGIDTDKMKIKRRGIEIDDRGKDEHVYGMLNAVADWQNDSAFTPYVGIGVGGTKAQLKNSYTRPGSGGEITRDSSDTAFAYQFLFGALWDINDDLGLEMRGRYFGSKDRTHDNHAAAKVADLDVDGSQIWTFELGLSYQF